MRPPCREDLAVFDEVEDALAHVRRVGVPYADLFSPLGDEAFDEAMRRLTVTVREEPLGRTELEAVTPPVYGRYVMVISSDVDRTRRRFARRHGAGHVAAGHVSEVTFLSNARDWRARHERVADVFALIDLLPWWSLDEARRRRLTWREMRQDCCQAIRYFTLDWPEERVLDRADLRLALYRTRRL